MPFGWVNQALQFFLVALGIPKSTIGLLSGVSLPYVLKVLWSPLVDRYALPWPGRRRLRVLAECVKEAKGDADGNPQTAQRLEAMHEFLIAMSGLFDEVVRMPTPALRGVIKLRGKVVTLLGGKKAG